ncbi:TetR/AcrR family transcriptional regulator [Couchioplanes azureus]|uniref:TetR/AcrR family transcriptional regulator n=1 Tax=Couchioplanes caeruleus TaxID=56438 RepID=UPI0019AB7D0F|nr:TetR/AcrR family transcriptional regulator [Couchioplanes caeruleus]GGQ50084.1 TetR family transcriptional regulator [Couchioplanes caeruleus subsp. azureus]
MVLYGARTSLRRDARRNRAAIVEAAIEVLRGRGSAALMPEIARRAGVALATLYRHFPDRHALTAAVIGHQLQELEAAAAASTDRPVSFRALLRTVLHWLIEMRALIALADGLEAGVRRRYQHRLVTAFTKPLRLAQERGYVRRDLVPGDLLLLFAMVQAVAATGDDTAAARAAADRSIDLMLDGVFRGSHACPPRDRTLPAANHPAP